MEFGGNETQLNRQCRILEAGLGQALTIVEASPHGEGLHVVAQAGQLALLHGADPPLGIEHHDPEAGPMPEGRGHGGSRIAAAPSMVCGPVPRR